MCIFLYIAPIFQKSPNSFGMNGGDDGTRTRGLCRDSGSVHATLFRGNSSWNAARI